ncbi:MAG: heavy metal translocating P-type ATPase [Akkermansiaceae bacterium]|nr:heavy metal translocating P-type ATPase [Akkermansiaceae bacterium]
MKKAHFRVTGMSCSACSARVDRCVRVLPGVQAVEVNLLTGSMVAEFDESQQSAGCIIAAVEAAGYGAELQKNAPAPDTRKDSRPLLRRFLLSLVFLLPMMVLHHALHGGVSIAAQALLLLPILWLNRKFFISGSRALRQKAPNMDTLIALGAAAGILYSIVDVCWLHSGVVYLESAGMILTLITFGKWLEARSTGRTGSALEKLRELLPDTANLLRGGTPITVPADTVQPGDILLVRPGERIPADGDVQQGVSTIDEAALTGESMPVDKQPGSPVYAGTINGHGALHILVRRCRKDSSLSDIITMVGEAAAAKAPIARLADRISGIFVPAVVLIALLTALTWILVGSTVSFAMGCAIAVLVISCPCALGLATPVAIMVGAGKGAELGILFRSGEVMENARNTTAVILDKTGTITAGAPVVTDVLPMNGTGRDELLRIAAALEAGSQHPIADAIRQFTAGMAYPEQQHHTYLPGLGVQGSINEQVCAAGNAALMHRLGISVDSPLAARMADEGKTPLFISCGTTLLGMIAVADAIKPDSAEAIRSMQQSGLRVIMMTGDNARTAQAVAAQVGISEIRTDVRPADKAAMVHRLRDEGYKVAMVGDGINDAPALTCADVGIAIGAGTDVAIESADIILLRSSLCDVVAALRLSRAIIRNIRQNLFWAFFYNILTIPLAAGVYYPLLGRTLSPGIAAAAMSLSSFCVVANALRLRRLKFGQKESATIPSPQQNTTITMNHTTVITVTGMMCPHCERHMTEAILALPGVTACTASHKENCVTIQSAERLSDELLRSTVEKAGYQYGGIKN